MAQKKYEAIIMVTRGDELPKKKFDRKVHPTYETSIRIKNDDNRRSKPHFVVKFFDQYRSLHEALNKLDIGEDKAFPIVAKFPPSYTASSLGLSLSEEQLQQRCYLLNKWVGEVFSNYSNFSVEAQNLLSDFLRLEGDDVAVVQNKDLILSLLKEVSLNKNPSEKYQKIEKSQNTSKIRSDNAENSDSGNKKPNQELSNNINKSESSSTKNKNLIEEDSSPMPSELDEDIKELSRSVLLPCGFLSVLVGRGDNIPKKREESKAHPSFEVLIRVLSFVELKIPQKLEIDDEIYKEKLYRQTPLSRIKFFEDFRKLRMTLQTTHVYSLNDETEINEAKKNNQELIVIKAAFPKTLRRSSLGLPLKSYQMDSRVAKLNAWFGNLLKMFKTLPFDAQEIISDFLSVPINNNSDVLAMEDLKSVLFTMFQERFILPKKIVKTEKKGSMKKMFSVKDKSKSIKSDSEGKFKDSDGVSSISDSATGTSTVRDVSPSRRESTDSEASNDNTAIVQEGSKEWIIQGFLAVIVEKGDKIAKSEGDKKLHNSYQTQLRVLKLEELQVAVEEKRNADKEKYEKLQNPEKLVKIAVFDEYRSLFQNLEKFQVYGLNSSKIANIIKTQETISEENSREYGELPNKSTLASFQKTPTGNGIIINSPFPRTYNRQKFGVQLTNTQIHRRMLALNNWMGKLLQSFYVLSPAAQELIINFFDLDTSNPATPQHQTIYSMLQRTYQLPQMLKVEIPIEKEKKEKSKTKAGFKNNIESTRDPESPKNEPNQESVAVGGCCVIT